MALLPAKAGIRISEPGGPASGGLGRAIVLGALLIPVNCLWVVRMERVSYGPYPSTVSLFANVVFTLFVLGGLNGLLRRWVPRLAFSQAELLVIYTMQAVSTGLAGLDGVSGLCQIVPHGTWDATPSNHWDTFLSAFPPWLVVRDKALVAGHFLGHDSFSRPAVLRAWAVPILAWTLFVSLLLFVAQCLNVLVRPQWADRERLTFPLVTLPLAMTEDGLGTAFYRNRLMWLGFALAGGLNLWNGVALFIPTWPAVPVAGMDLKPFFVDKPWSGISWFPITFYPFVIGLGFLLPLDLLFSCWFFFLFWNGQTVVTNLTGQDSVPDFPFVTEQGFGAVLGLFLFYLWSGRTYYAGLWRQAWGQRGRDADAQVARFAFLGIGAGLCGLMAFGHAAGAAWWLIAAFLILYLATALVVTRIRAELGPPVHDFHFMGPDVMLPRVLGTVPLRHTDMAFLTCTYALTRAHRADTMPIGLEGLQMAHLRRFNAGGMFGAIMLATVLGCLSTFWATESQAYRFGTEVHFASGQGVAQEAFQRLEGWLHGDLSLLPNRPATAAIGVGLLCALALFALRLRFVGFPLHPIGYAISSSWAIHLIWFPLLIAWALKGLTLRYGGLGLYRSFLPFFLGLVLGDCVMGSLWGLIGLLLNVRTYNFFGA